ncbi:maturation protein [ssRNA phage SRR5466727_3]|uniref:Maturation protein n=1 Tax=ssRNA phage SRR5466727_3 TaxID=2786432 RepID=A0A8S5L543_9VIRU|nr:maturation protein [ssRNA phage SRR5466727_3]DAD52447.1 TPA_asm: maturation protein [ssRNA phage SRR5466727_3]
MALSPNADVVRSAPVYYSHVNVNGAVYTASNVIAWTTYDRLLTTIVSVNTPNWRSYRNKWKPHNNYSKRVATISDPIRVVTLIYTGSHGTSVLKYVNANAQFLGASYSGAAKNADDPTQKVVAKLQEQITLQKASTLVTVAEAHKTAKHLAETAKRVAAALKALKSLNIAGFGNALGINVSKRQVKRFRTQSKDIRKYPGKPFSQMTTKEELRLRDFAANTWLEYSYAWKPLLGDIYANAEALASAMVEKSPNQRVVTAKSHSFISGEYETANSGWISRHDYQKKLEVRMKLWYTIDVDSNPIVSACGLTNPLLVAWEIVPFSFVVDWFLPIGNYLESLTAYRGVTFRGGTKTTRATDVVNTYVRANKQYAYGTGTMTPVGSAESQYRNFSITREGLSGFPTLNFPRFKDPRSIAHAASALALLHSIFHGSGNSSTRRF